MDKRTGRCDIAGSMDSFERTVVETPTVTMTLDEEGIILVAPHDDTEQTAEDARENCRAGRELAAGRRVAVMVDTRVQTPPSREAQQVYVDDNWACAMALIFDSTFSRVSANFFIRVARPKWPVKGFSDVAEARAWLRDQLA